MKQSKSAEYVPQFISVQNAARMLDISTRTVRRKVTSREWPHVRVGKMIRLEVNVILGRERLPPPWIKL